MGSHIFTMLMLNTPFLSPFYTIPICLLSQNSKYSVFTCFHSFYMLRPVFFIFSVSALAHCACFFLTSGCPSAAIDRSFSHLVTPVCYCVCLLLPWTARCLLADPAFMLPPCQAAVGSPTATVDTCLPLTLSAASVVCCIS